MPIKLNIKNQFALQPLHFYEFISNSFLITRPFIKKTFRINVGSHFSLGSSDWTGMSGDVIMSGELVNLLKETVAMFELFGVFHQYVLRCKKKGWRFYLMLKYQHIMSQPFVFYVCACDLSPFLMLKRQRQMNSVVMLIVKTLNILQKQR